MQNFREAALHLTKKYTNGYSKREVKVLDTTSNARGVPSGPHMHEIALMTYNRHGFVEVMGILDKRLSDIGKNWRCVYKSLLVLRYILLRGSDNVLFFLRDHIESISILRTFGYVSDDGHDYGNHVRRHAGKLVTFVRDDPRHRERRRDLDARVVYEVYGSADSSGRRRRVTKKITRTREQEKLIAALKEKYRAEESKNTIEGSNVQQSEDVLGNYFDKPYRGVEDLMWGVGDDERMQGVEQHGEEVEIDAQRTFVHPNGRFKSKADFEEMEAMEHRAVLYRAILRHSQSTSEPHLPLSERQRQDTDGDVPRPGFGMNQVESMDASAILNDQDHSYVAQMYPYSEKKVLTVYHSLPATTRMNTFLPTTNMTLPTPQPLSERRRQDTDNNVPQPGFGVKQVESTDASAILNDQNHSYVAQMYPYSEKKVLEMRYSLPTTTRMNTFLPTANMTLPTPQITTLRPQFASSNPFKLQAEQEAAQANSLQQQHVDNHGRDESENIHVFEPFNDISPSHTIDFTPYPTLYNPDISQYQPGISEADHDRQVQLYFPHRQQEGQSQHQQLAQLPRYEEWTIQHQIMLQLQLDRQYAGLPPFSQRQRGVGQIQQQLVQPHRTDGTEANHFKTKPFTTTNPHQRRNKTLSMLVAILNEHRHYRSLLKCSRSDAQIILELCQMLLDSYEVASDIRRQIVTAMQRLAAKSKSFPSYFFVRGPIFLADENAISSGSFGDIYKATLHTETLCLKVLRANRSILEKLAKVCCIPFL
ncbi:hypothetical protein DXG01_005646 [Tephrocybe rancida]|nr:hypothetical protein DXG01_005646 [Tephrocybe rancida]